jgi:uncharacterized protein (TIGR02266 family)
MYCPACGGQLPGSAHFCGFCGFRLTPMPDPFANPPATAATAPAEQPVLLTQKKGTEPTPQPQSTPVTSASGTVTSSPRPSASGIPAASAAAAPAAAGKPAAGKPGTPAAGSPRADATVQRRAPRFPLRVEISYESDHNFFNGFTENISHGGIFIATHSPKKLGETVELTFTLPGINLPLHIEGRVQWVRDYNPSAPDSIPGMGVEFVDLGEKEKIVVEAFIRHREPIFFDM